VTQLYGSEYALPQPRRYRKKQRGAQEAHEAIRPTSAARHPDQLQGVLDPGQAKLYRLIWQRTVASQMAEARFDQVSVDIEAKPKSEGPAYMLRATGQTLKFDGFRRVYFEGRDDTPDEDAEATLPRLTAEQALRLLELLHEQHFTQPPPRYTEASLVKALEENGIGRPSTYAPTISTLLDRRYVRLDERRFFPEDIGMVVADLLVQFFPDVFEVGFTARMEEGLDDVAEGKAQWIKVLNDFYEPFMEDLKVADKEMEAPEEELEELCPKCLAEGRGEVKLRIKLGRFGRFISCPNYPVCTYTRDLGEGAEGSEPELLDEKCPECGRPLQRRRGRFGPFIGCSGYPECKYIKKEQPVGTGVTCPECKQGELVQRRGRFGPFYSCSRYPECKFAVNQTPLPEPCPECQGLVVSARGGARRCTSCGRGWDADGNELSETEAKALVSPGRRSARSGSKSNGARGSSGEDVPKRKRRTVRAKRQT
jgi:DNA topoisomerase-1